MLTAVRTGVVDHPCIKHRSLDMTLRYARISNRVVADEYDAVSAKVEALYRDSALPADAEGPNMRRLRGPRVALVPAEYVTPPVNQDELHLVEHSSRCAYFRLHQHEQLEVDGLPRARRHVGTLPAARASGSSFSCRTVAQGCALPSPREPPRFTHTVRQPSLVAVSMSYSLLAAT